MAKPMVDWTPAEHIAEACDLMAKAGSVSGTRSTGNAPVGVVVAGVHANIAQAKLLLSVTVVLR